MSRIFLLATNTFTEPYPVYPIGMSVVASALARAGHEVGQWDVLSSGASVETLRGAIVSFNPDFVGLSLRNIDTVDSTAPQEERFLAADRRLVAVIRQATCAPVIVGGPAFSLLPGEILDFLGADYGVVGEGERTAVELVEALGSGRAVPAIRRSAGPGLSGDQMCPALVDADTVRWYLKESGLANVQTKRGCPHGCIYCSYPALEGGRFRHRDARAVVDDIELLVRDHGAGSIFFTDSIFNDDDRRYLGIAEELIRRGTPIRWSAFFRPQGLDRSSLSLMKRSGLFAVELGTDAASDATLEGINKGFTFAEAEAATAACAAEEIPAAHYVLFGGPGETPDTVREGIDNLRRLPTCVVFAFVGIRILPGTALHARAVTEGVVTRETPLLHPIFYFSPGIDREEMAATIAAGFKGRRDRIFPPSEGKLRMDVMRRFGYKGLLWDHLLSFGKPGRGRGATPA